MGVRFSHGSPSFAGVLLGEDSAFQADEVGSNPTTRSKCPSGGIGRRAGLRSQCRKACEFESRGGHQSFRGVEKKNLTWLITKRTVVQIHPPQPVLFHDSTEVVQLTVNQLVPGSIPGRGASFMGRCAERRRQRTVNPSHQKHRRFDSYSTHQYYALLVKWYNT